MKILKSLPLCFALLLGQLNASAQSVPADLTELLNHTLDSMRTVLNAKSLSAAMHFPDGAIWAHADGISSAVPLVNVTPDHVYLIGSVTKTITSACILQMADENLLDLDDGIYEWLDTMPYVSPNITIRHLMRHTSGLYDVLSNPACQPALLANISEIWTPQELIDNFLQAPLFQPGATWSYSNTNYMLLALIIQEVSGNPFYTEIRNRFYTPLGLNSFSIPAFEPITDTIAHVWLDITGDNVTDDAHNFYMNYLSLNSTAGAAGGYFATPTDCTRWMHTYMRGDLHSEAIMAEAKTVVPAQGSQGGKYGLGLMENRFLGNQAYGHGGDLAYAASSWYFPGKDLSITVFTNDSKKNSWTLLPVVTELLRDCMNYQPATTALPSFEAQGLSMQAFPNPFHDQLSLSVHLTESKGALELQLSNAQGALIASVHQAYAPAGETVLGFQQLASLPAGVYFVTAFINGFPAGVVRVVK